MERARPEEDSGGGPFHFFEDGRLFMTLGEYRVGIDFNPSKNEKVDQIKRAIADVIDLVQEIETPIANVEEVKRLKALASTALEDAAMWAVKAATKRDRD